MQKGNQFVNPLRVNVPRRGGVPKQLLADYLTVRTALYSLDRRTEKRLGTVEVASHAEKRYNKNAHHSKPHHY